MVFQITAISRLSRVSCLGLKQMAWLVSYDQRWGYWGSDGRYAVHDNRLLAVQHVRFIQALCFSCCWLLKGTRRVRLFAPVPALIMRNNERWRPAWPPLQLVRESSLVTKDRSIEVAFPSIYQLYYCHCGLDSFHQHLSSCGASTYIEIVSVSVSGRLDLLMIKQLIIIGCLGHFCCCKLEIYWKLHSFHLFC